MPKILNPRIEKMSETLQTHPALQALIPALLAGLVYLPALKGSFVWDDTIFLYDVPLYRDPARWVEALCRPFILGPNYFRPLALVTFLLELRLWDSWPLPYHLVNVLLHALNTALVATLARRVWPSSLRNRPWLPLVPGLLYGLHPALVESVAFISSRFDLMLTTGLLLALVADISLRDHAWVRSLAVGLCFFAAALAKEMAVAFVLAMPFWYMATDRDTDTARYGQGMWAKTGIARTYAVMSSQWRVFAAVFIAGLGYLALRHTLLGYLYLPESGNPIAVGKGLQHLLLVTRSLAEYIMLAVWPFTTLTPIHWRPVPFPLHDVSAWLILPAMLALAGGWVWLLNRHPRSGWLTAAGVVALAPVLNLLPLELGGGSFAAERFLTFPLAFMVLAAVPVFQTSWRRITFTGLACWLVGSVLTIQLVLPHWRNDMALWRWAAERAPQSTTPHVNLAKVYNEQGWYEDALDETDCALQRDPAASNGWNHRGLALFHIGRYAEARDAFTEAVRLEPSDPLYWNNLAGALRELGRLQEAEQVLLDHSLRLAPDLPVAHLNLGIVYLRADRPDLAANHLQEAVRLLPSDGVEEVRLMLAQTREPAIWLRLGNVLLDQGKARDALAAFEQSDQLGASKLEVLIGRSAALINLGEWAAAQEALEAALRIEPGDARIFNNLGVIARERGEREQARHHFSRAAELAPAWELPRHNLEALN